jgi:hypothetical protein
MSRSEHITARGKRHDIHGRQREDLLKIFYEYDGAG